MAAQCPICFDSPPLEPVVATCGHTVCIKCTVSPCPICRKPGVVYKPNYMLRQILSQSPEYVKAVEEYRYQNSLQYYMDEIERKWEKVTIEDSNSAYSEEIQRKILSILAEHGPKQLTPILPFFDRSTGIIMGNHSALNW